MQEQALRLTKKERRLHKQRALEAIAVAGAAGQYHVSLSIITRHKLTRTCVGCAARSNARWVEVDGVTYRVCIRCYDEHHTYELPIWSAAPVLAYASAGDSDGESV